MVENPQDPAEKPSRRQRRDPDAEKLKDITRQRKIGCNSSDKAARRHVPRIKAEGNRAARRAAKVSVTAVEGDDYDESAQAAIVHHRAKPKTWGSHNAADFRASRAEERRILDETADVPGLPKGRQRAAVVRAMPDQTPTGKK